MRTSAPRNRVLDSLICRGGAFQNRSHSEGWLIWLYMRRRRSATAALRQKFGPEYDRAVLAQGSERKAESKLADREKRVEKLKIRDLESTEHERFSKQWASVQSRFVDSPMGAVAEADDLLSQVMKARGYPV